MLTTPDILKFKIPIPFAFVPPNPKYDPKQAGGVKLPSEKQVKLADEADYKKSPDCVKYLNNYNKCVFNNSLELCSYYMNHMNLNCK